MTEFRWDDRRPGARQAVVFFFDRLHETIPTRGIGIFRQRGDQSTSIGDQGVDCGLHVFGLDAREGGIGVIFK